MHSVYQINHFTTVETLGDDELLAKSILLSTGFEAAGRLVADQSSFQIKKARWDIYRSPGSSLNGGSEIPGLIGIEAYLNSGRALRRIIGKESGGLPGELLTECIKGIIQAEAFIFRKRGYPSLQVYGECWDRDYLNACRYFSNLERRSSRWYDEPDYGDRVLTLFSRNKSCTLCRQNDGNFAASGNFIDTFHEVFVQLIVNSKGFVTASSGNLNRATGQVCTESIELIVKLIDQNITKLSKKEIGELVGGPQGCDHLVDLINELSRSVVIVIGRK